MFNLQTAKEEADLLFDPLLQGQGVPSVERRPDADFLRGLTELGEEAVIAGAPTRRPTTQELQRRFLEGIGISAEEAQARARSPEALRVERQRLAGPSLIHPSWFTRDFSVKAYGRINPFEMRKEYARRFRDHVALRDDPISFEEFRRSHSGVKFSAPGIPELSGMRNSYDTYVKNFRAMKAGDPLAIMPSEHDREIARGTLKRTIEIAKEGDRRATERAMVDMFRNFPEIFIGR